MESKLILTRTLTIFGILQNWLYYKGYTLRATLKTQLYSFAFAQPRNYALGFVVRIYVLSHLWIYISFHGAKLCPLALVPLVRGPLALGPLSSTFTPRP